MTRYYYAFKDSDGSWSGWIECSLDYYDRVQNRWDVTTTTEDES